MSMMKMQKTDWFENFSAFLGEHGYSFSLEDSYCDMEFEEIYEGDTVCFIDASFMFKNGDKYISVAIEEGPGNIGVDASYEHPLQYYLEFNDGDETYFPDDIQMKIDDGEELSEDLVFFDEVTSFSEEYDWWSIILDAMNKSE